MLFLKGMQFKLFQILIRAPPYLSSIGNFIESIHLEKRCLRSCNLIFVPREENSASQSRAKELLVIRLTCMCLLEDIPRSIFNVVLREALFLDPYCFGINFFNVFD
jgi:hypothetical protein